MLPELEEFRRQLRELAKHPILRPVTKKDQVQLSKLTLSHIEELLRDNTAYYFLLAAAQLNRTSLRVASLSEEAQLVSPRLRRAYAVRSRLPLTVNYEAVAESATSLRNGDLQRKARGQTEQLFRERLVEEGIPLLMSPPRITVPGVLISQRKPDGIWPDPKSGAAPEVYLEIKRIRRVADDIQKRLYELAEASLEMKMLYSGMHLRGLEATPAEVLVREGVAQSLRGQITGARPTVIGLFLCPREEAGKYRLGAQALIDRIFFQEEIDECIDLLREITLG